MFDKPEANPLRANTDPQAPIAKSFWVNEEMGDLILDGVVCVVDSRNVLDVRKNLHTVPGKSLTITLCSN